MKHNFVQNDEHSVLTIKITGTLHVGDCECSVGNGSLDFEKGIEVPKLNRFQDVVGGAVEDTRRPTCEASLKGVCSIFLRK